MKRILLACLLLAGCGDFNKDKVADNNNHGYGYSYDGITADGLRVQQHVKALIPQPWLTQAVNDTYIEVEQCSGLTAPAPFVVIDSQDNISRRAGHLSNGITYLDPKPYLIVIVPDTEIEIGFRHESIHYLLDINGFPRDRNYAHDSPLFDTCGIGPLVLVPLAKL